MQRTPHRSCLALVSDAMCTQAARLRWRQSRCLANARKPQRSTRFKPTTTHFHAAASSATAAAPASACSSQPSRHQDIAAATLRRASRSIPRRCVLPSPAAHRHAHSLQCTPLSTQARKAFSTVQRLRSLVPTASRHALTASASRCAPHRLSAVKHALRRSRRPAAVSAIATITRPSSASLP